MRFIVRWLITAVAVAVTVWLLPGVRIEGGDGWVAVLVMAAVLALVNIFVKPIMRFLSCGLIMATFGLFLVVINALAFALASWITVNWLDIGFYIDNFWWALLGGLIISLVSFLLDLIIPGQQ
jgi:putative membrane protein